MRLPEVVAQFGGPLPAADMSCVVVTRKAGAKETLDLSHPETRGATANNVVLNMDAINGMGGPTWEANLKNVILVHIPEDKKSAKAIKLNLEKYLKKGDFKYNMPLAAGDGVIVPEKKHTTDDSNLWAFLSELGLVTGGWHTFTGHYGD